METCIYRLSAKSEAEGRKKARIVHHHNTGLAKECVSFCCQ